MANLSKPRYGLFFTVVFIYIIASFIWWFYLLHQNNLDNYRKLIEDETSSYIDNGGTRQQFYETQLYKTIHQDFTRKEFMLYGEGLVFLTLISIGFLRIRNTFREEIELTRRQNNFLLSITHELKSPLASLKLSVQTMQKRNLDTAQVKHIADISMEDLERLESLVENILLASKIETSDFKLHKDLVNLSEITGAIFDKTKEKFKAQRNFESNIEKDVYVNADRLSFTSVINNLIENAIKYSSEGSTIKVDLQGDEKNAYLSIADTGNGIPEKEKTKIFDRFYRIGNEETRITKGTGLGLFIVKQIVALHNGIINVKNNAPKGSIFEVTIPIG